MHFFYVCFEIELKICYHNIPKFIIIFLLFWILMVIYMEIFLFYLFLIIIMELIFKFIFLISIFNISIIQIKKFFCFIIFYIIY